MLLELRNIHKRYKNHIIYENLTIAFSAAGFYLLSGPSGSGKTTLLNIIAGYEPFEKGERICHSKMACIFQSYELIEELTVLENIRMSVDLHGNVFEDDLIRKLGIENILNHYPSELSGGQKQRVGILRALYQNPEIILCDEPTESLDTENKTVVLELLKDLSKEKVVIVACHELDIIEPYYDVHYRIHQQQLQLIKQRRALVEKEVSHDKTTYQSSILKHYIHQNVSKRTRLATLILCLLMILQIGLYAFDIKMFTPKTSLDALNGHVIYVNLFDEEASYLSNIGLESKPIIAFDSVTIGGKKYKINIYPLESEFHSLENNEIIINTLASELLGDLNEIKLTYQIDDLALEKTYQIKEIIEEKDAYYPQIYYNLEDLLGELSPYLQEKIKKESSYYEVITHKATTLKLYQSLSDNPNIMISHSIFDVRLENEKMMSLYHLLFQAIEVIALLTTIIAILYFNKKETDKNKTALSLIYSLQVPMKEIKKIYFFERAKVLTLASLWLILIFIILKNWIATLYIFVIFDIYVTSLFIQVVSFKSKDISMILKENKD